jgi:hypothetical protein
MVGKRDARLPATGTDTDSHDLKTAGANYPGRPALAICQRTFDHSIFRIFRRELTSYPSVYQCYVATKVYKCNNIGKYTCKTHILQLRDLPPVQMCSGLART